MSAAGANTGRRPVVTSARVAGSRKATTTSPGATPGIDQVPSAPVGVAASSSPVGGSTIRAYTPAAAVRPPMVADPPMVPAPVRATSRVWVPPLPVVTVVAPALVRLPPP